MTLVDLISIEWSSFRLSADNTKQQLNLLYLPLNPPAHRYRAELHFCLPLFKVSKVKILF